MIENLNTLTFSAFGEIHFKENKKEYQHTHLLLREAPEAYWVWEDAPVILDNPQGMVLLEIFHAATGRSLTFYLDKPVRLLPGVPFALFPLQPPCEAELYTWEGAARSTFPMQKGGEPIVYPTVRIPRLYTLFYQERPKGFLFPGESHEPYELTYVDMGKLHCVVGGRDLTLGQQELILFAPRQWHMQYTQQDMPASFVTISFDVLPLELNLPCGIVLSAGREINACLQRILDLQKEEGLYQGDMIICLCTQVLLLLLRSQLNHAKKEEPSAATENLLVERALLYIDSHYIRNLTVKEVASHIHVSPSYLATLFRRQLQISPSRYIQRLKLAHGRHLLLKGEESITQVAAALSYATPQHFSRCFKKEFGFSPRAFTRSLKVSGTSGGRFREIETPSPKR